MIKFIICLDFYVDEESESIPLDFRNSANKLITSLFKNFSDVSTSMSIISPIQKPQEITLSRTSLIDLLAPEEILFRNDDLRELYFILKIDLIDHHKNISYVWDRIEKASSVGCSISVLGPTESVNGEARLGQQGFENGEMSTGFFTLDDPEDAIVEIAQLPEPVQLALFEFKN
jgi:hypothetical protein